MGRGGGQVVSVLAFYSDNPSLNPALKFGFEKKEAAVGPFKKLKASTKLLWRGDEEKVLQLVHNNQCDQKK